MEMKRAVKDSVFTYLFGLPEYRLELYRTLHPEDTEMKAEDLKLVTIENVLTADLYNDLGFQAGDKLIVLVEAQSTFSPNIALRLLLYLAETYKRYIQENRLQLKLYQKKPLKIPRPELYVVYTGREQSPDVFHLSDLYEGKGSAEIEVKVLRGGDKGTIVDQYARFCRIVDEQRKLHGDDRQKIAGEVIRICLEEGILVPFLAVHQREVQDIMFTLFNQEEITRLYGEEQASIARAEGEAHGKAQGEARVMALIQRLIASGKGSEVERVTTDTKYRETLYHQYGLT